LTNILNAINESMGEGLEYNNKLIDDPGATLTRIVTRCRLPYRHTKHYLQLLADQGLVTIDTYQRKRARKSGRDIKRPTVMTVKITDKGYKYLLLKEEEEVEEKVTEKEIADFTAKTEEKESEEDQGKAQTQDQELLDLHVLAEKIKNNDHKWIEQEARREGLTITDFVKRRLHFAAKRTREISRSFEIHYEITRRYMKANPEETEELKSTMELLKREAGLSKKVWKSMEEDMRNYDLNY
jgi:predicted transcriptional regulator